VKKAKGMGRGGMRGGAKVIFVESARRDPRERGERTERDRVEGQEGGGGAMRKEAGGWVGEGNGWG